METGVRGTSAGPARGALAPSPVGVGAPVPAPRTDDDGRAALAQMAQQLAVSASARRAVEPVDLTTLLASLGSMASSGPVAAQVMALASDRDTGAPQLAKTLAADAVLAAKVLRLANSAAYGMSTRVSDLPRAVAVVGMASVSTLAAISVAGLDDPQLPVRFWNRSVATAAGSRVLARSFGLPPEDALVTGLLSNLGSALLFRHDTVWYRLLLAGQPTRSEMLAAEQDRFGTTQTAITAAALSRWAFPRAIVDAVHPGPEPGRGARCLMTVHEAVGRVLDPRQEPTDPLEMSGGAVSEARLSGALPIVVRETERMLAVLSAGRR